MANEFVARNGIISLDGGQITGSLRVTQGVTASLFGTASWAINSTTASFVLNAVSASFASTASSVNPLVQNVLITGSLFVSSSNQTQLRVGSNLLFVSSSGQVGIGTTSPINTLHVVGTGRFTDSLAISTAVSTGDAFIELGTGRSASGNAYIDLVGDTTYTDFALRIIRGSAGANATSQIIHRGTGAFSIIAQDAASLALSTTNSARLTILSGGSVGIGSTSPVYNLDVVGALRSTGNTFLATGGTNVGIGTTVVGSRLQVNGNTAIGYSTSTAAPTNGLQVSGSIAVNTTLASWASTFRVLQIGARTALFNSDINFTGLYNNIYYDGAAYRYLTTAAASSIELGGGVITFGTVASGTAGNTAAGSERMRIINDGNVGIGTTSPAYKLDVNGAIQTDNPSGGSKKPWKLGNVVATSVVLDENNYVEVEINGNAYKLALVNPA